tara:strand:+ start:639 stop:1385 length:747 start_codon:yes stop_codon:yes gene_type:complete
MKDQDLLRYSRQILLPEIDVEGQQRINNARVVVIGLGALGSIAANYLCRAGIGELILCDYDHVDISNLHRQVLFQESDINKSKVNQTLEALSKIRSDSSVQGIEKEIDIEVLTEFILNGEIIIDATDNFTSRYAINSVAFIKKAFLISGAALGWSGQISVFNFELPNSSCYECCFGFTEQEDLSCSEAGILAPITGIIGSMQVIEALKKILNLSSYRESILENYDFLKGETQRLNIKRDPLCSTCGNK